MDINQATIEINKILKNLEEDQGVVVEDIGLSVIDATSVGDDRPRNLTTSFINCRRLPANGWSI